MHQNGTLPFYATLHILLLPCFYMVALLVFANFLFVKFLSPNFFFLKLALVEIMPVDDTIFFQNLSFLFSFLEAQSSYCVADFHVLQQYDKF